MTVAPLSVLLNLPDATYTDSSPLILLEESAKSTHKAILVENIIGETSLNIYPLPQAIGSIPAIEGIAISSENGIILTLEIEGLLSSFHFFSQKKNDTPDAPHCLNLQSQNPRCR